MRPSRQKFRRWLVGLLLATALYAAVGFLIVPFVARQQIQSQGSHALRREVTLGDVYFNPFTFFVSLRQLRIVGRDDEGLATWQEAKLNFDVFESLIRWQWRFGDMALVSPGVRLVVDESGKLNIADLIGGAPSESGAGPPRFGLDRLTVQDGRVEFADRSLAPPFSTVVEPINFTLADFSTKVDDSGGYQLSATTNDGGTLSWRGDVSATPFASHGRLDIQNVSLPAYMPFIAPYLDGEIRSGRLAISGSYKVTWGSAKTATVTALRAGVTDFQIALPDATEPSIVLPELVIEVPEADLLNRSAHVSRVALDGPSVRAARERNGAIDLAGLVPTEQPSSATSSNVSTKTNAADVRVDEITVRQGTLAFTDLAAPEPARLHASELALTVKGASTALDQNVALDLSLQWANGPGELTVTGTARPQPLALDLQVRGSQLALAPLAAYLPRAAQIQLTSGGAEIDGRVEAGLPSDGPLEVRWTGQLAIDNFGSETGGSKLLSFERLALTNSRFTLEPMHLEAAEIRLLAPLAQVRISENGTLNVAAAFSTETKQQSANAAATAPPPTDERAPQSLPFTAQIGSVVIENGTIALDDESLDLAFSTQVSGLGGRISGISTAPDAHAQVDLAASIAGSSPLAVRGTLGLLGPELLSGSDLKVDLTGLDLELLEPYAARYLGYRVEQGRMRGDFAYQVTGAALEGRNHVVLDHFFLGTQVESPHAVSLPIKLALAVLRNRQGEIELNVPVSGSLRSPEFSFVGAVAGAFRNSVSKIATAPFALLGSLFNVSADDLGQAEFPPGLQDLTTETRTKLETLARALQARPSLQLTIHWEPYPEVDRDMLRERRLRELLRGARTPQSPTDVRSSEDPLTDPDAVRTLYRQRISGEALPSGAAEKTTPTPEQEQRLHWWTRLFRFLFGDPENDDPAIPEKLAAEENGTGPAEPGLEKMREQLLTTISLDDADFAKLAKARAEAVRHHLTESGVEPERAKVAVEPGTPPDSPKGSGAARVTFSLGEFTATLSRMPDEANGSTHREGSAAPPAAEDQPARSPPDESPGD